MKVLSRMVCFPALLLGVALMIGVGEAAATLGQPPAVPGIAAASLAPAARALATKPGAHVGLYTQHTVLLENGTTVHEYATPAGQVFAVVWRGPVLPDLSALLGGYFAGFKAEAERARSMGQRGAPVHLASDKLVVRSTGRMRGFFGYAYAPDLVPAGLNIHGLLQ